MKVIDYQVGQALIVLVFLSLLTACVGGDSSNQSSDLTVHCELSAGQPQRQNILLVIADDVGRDAVSMYAVGNEKPSTPTLDALASDGLVFDNAWANPACVPTRSTILTSRYGIRNGVLNNSFRPSLSETSIQEFVDTNVPSTYGHGVFGKWQLHNEANGGIDHPNLEGVDHFAGLMFGRPIDNYDWPMVVNGRRFSSNVYTTTQFVDSAIEWIGQQQCPWIAWLSISATHKPFHLPPLSLHDRHNLSGDADDIEATPLPYYLASIEAMDSELGRLLDSLGADERANTVVIFVGDNGTPRQVIQGFRPAHGKGSVYEGGVGVPLVVSGNGVTRRGEREEALVNSVDIFATIAELAGAGTREFNDSKSFAPLLTESGTGLRDFAYAEFKDETRDDWAIRDNRNKLVQRSNTGTEIYDLQQDPLEENNLLGPGRTASELAEVAPILEELQAQADLIRQ